MVIVRNGHVGAHIGTRHRRKAVDDGADKEAFAISYGSGFGLEDQRGRVPTHRYRYQPQVGAA